jgi:hypothetical protein
MDIIGKLVAIDSIDSKESFLRNELKVGIYSEDELVELKREAVIVRHLSLKHIVDLKMKEMEFSSSEEAAKKQSIVRKFMLGFSMVWPF